MFQIFLNFTKIINQVRLLIDDLCKAKHVNLPDNFNELNNYQISTSYINNQVSTTTN